MAIVTWFAYKPLLLDTRQDLGGDCYVVCLQTTTAGHKTRHLGSDRYVAGVLSGCFCLLVAYRPINMLVYLRDGCAKTSLRAATLRWKLQIQFSTSPNHSILTTGRPITALILYRQAPGRVAVWSGSCEPNLIIIIIMVIIMMTLKKKGATRVFFFFFCAIFSLR